MTPKPLCRPVLLLLAAAIAGCSSLGGQNQSREYAVSAHLEATKPFCIYQYDIFINGKRPYPWVQPATRLCTNSKPSRDGLFRDSEGGAVAIPNVAYKTLSFEYKRSPDGATLRTEFDISSGVRAREGHEVFQLSPVVTEDGVKLIRTDVFGPKEKPQFLKVVMADVKVAQ